MSGSAEKKEASKEGEAKPAGKPEDNVDKDYVIFHFPGVEQRDGTSAGCETLKIPRDAAIDLVQKVLHWSMTFRYETAPITAVVVTGLVGAYPVNIEE